MYSIFLGPAVFVQNSFLLPQYHPLFCYTMSSNEVKRKKSLISANFLYNLKEKSLYDITQTDFQFPCVINRCFRIWM